MKLNEIKRIGIDKFLSPTNKQAIELSGGKLPKIDYDKKVEVEGMNYWLCRTAHAGQTVWFLSEIYDRA